MKGFADLHSDGRPDVPLPADVPEGDPDVLIVGGGVVGVSAAYALASRGSRVMVIDAGPIGAGCSYGNAGLIVPSHGLPLATPGVVGQGLKWMLDPESPFYIKPRLDLGLLQWLMRFRAASTVEHSRRSMHVLLELLRASRRLFDDWGTLEGMEGAYDPKGDVHVYRTARAFAAAREEAEMMAAAGVESTVLDADGVREHVPQVRRGIKGGIFHQDDAHVDPYKFVRGLARLAEAKGAAFFDHTEAVGFRTRGGRVTVVRTTRGDIRPHEVVIAAGAWTPAVARDLKLRLPIQPAKGYSLTFVRPEASPSLPVQLGEARIAITPMGGLLRFAGTLELAGMNFSINHRRVNAIRRAPAEYLDGMDDLELVEIWRGLRPCTPDGLPIIGRAGGWENVVVAAGHAMIGVSLGPITGEIVARILCSEPAGFNLIPLRQERFN